MTCQTCKIIDGKLKRCSICLTGMNIRCGVTCGCGNTMIEYTGCKEEGVIILTCYPFSEKYKHPQMIRIGEFKND